MGIPLRLHDLQCIMCYYFLIGSQGTASNFDLASFVMDWLCTLESKADLALDVVVVDAFNAWSNCDFDVTTLALGDLYASAFSNLDLASFTG